MFRIISHQFLNDAGRPLQDLDLKLLRRVHVNGSPASDATAVKFTVGPQGFALFQVFDGIDPQVLILEVSDKAPKAAPVTGARRRVALLINVDKETSGDALFLFHVSRDDGRPAQALEVTQHSLLTATGAALCTAPKVNSLGDGWFSGRWNQPSGLLALTVKAEGVSPGRSQIVVPVVRG